jgi:hypothetical protein
MESVMNVTGELNSIGLKYNTDKSSIYHNYLNKYEKYLPFNRQDKIKILEIGVLNGGSVKTWSEYYPNAEIVGLDINPQCKQYEGGNIKIEIGSQADSNFLRSICDKYGKFDFIIDDGSHMSSHMIFSFKELFHAVVPHGLYVVEDVCCSYWKDFEGGLNKPNTCVEYFKSLVDEVNYLGLVANSPHLHRRDDSILTAQEKSNGKNYIGLEIESINFLNSIIIVVKK